MTYNFSYAAGAFVGPLPPMQLEFWVRGTRRGTGEWVPSHTVPVGNYHPWRKVRVGHTHKDRVPHSIASVKSMHSRTQAQICMEYCQWAKRAGLHEVTVYSDSAHSQNGAHSAGLMWAREVTRDDILGPAPAPETDAV